MHATGVFSAVDSEHVFDHMAVLVDLEEERLADECDD